jgi:hypothetical protein
MIAEGPMPRQSNVEKLVSGRGSVKSGFIASKGEAGFQPDALRGRWHLFFPFQYRIHSVPLQGPGVRNPELPKPNLRC